MYNIYDDFERVNESLVELLELSSQRYMDAADQAYDRADRSREKARRSEALPAAYQAAATMYRTDQGNRFSRAASIMRGVEKGKPRKKLPVGHFFGNTDRGRADTNYSRKNS
jgi:hypothetical protein